VHADIEMMLWRDFVETATTGIPFYGDYCQAVAGIFADTVVRHHQPLVEVFLECQRFVEQRLLFFLGFLYNVFQLRIFDA
jgi:hypothetical protein